MFKVQKHKIGRFSTVRLINDSTQEYLEVLTDFGAGLNDLVIRNGEHQLVSVIDGYRTEDEVIHQHHSAFKGSKLSPFPNRISGGQYEFKDQHYQLPINEVKANNNLHAFLHNVPFELKEESVDEHAASIILTYNYKGAEQGFPFPYKLALTYRLSEDEVSVTTDIENLSGTEIPMGDGWHPYFRFEDLNSIQMQMGAASRMSSNVGNAVSAIHGFEQSKAIGDSILDDCFEVVDAQQFSINLKDLANGISLEIWQESTEKKYKYFQIFTPSSRKTVAIEPVTCTPNAFNTGQGLIVLKPNEKMSMSFGIKNLLLNK